MNLPLASPYLPMEAATAAKIPEGPNWQYEPKWDGFRCLAFRDGTEIELQSKSGQTLTRYFPELVAGLLNLKAPQFVLDGEIVIVHEGNLSFERLLQRIHPADSRVRKLAQETPSMMICFDLLVDDHMSLLTGEPLSERRPKLEAFAAKYFEENQPVALSPATCQLSEAKDWYRTMGGGLDGIVAKRIDMQYVPGERGGMVKIKNLRSADCVVGGFRYASKGQTVGSLLLGLYDEAGVLHHVGFCSSIHAKDREEVTAKLEARKGGSGFTGRAPGGPSRWSTERSTEWESLKPDLVVEVQYDHYAGGRFRHGTKLLRWRPDKAPSQCTMDQVGRESRSPVGLLS